GGVPLQRAAPGGRPGLVTGQGRGGGAAFGIGQARTVPADIEAIPAVLFQGPLQALNLAPVTGSRSGKDEVVLGHVQYELRTTGGVDPAQQLPALLRRLRRWIVENRLFGQQFAHRPQPGGGGPVVAHVHTLQRGSLDTAVLTL